MTAGWNESSPMAIQRKDDPQISEMVSRSAQSTRLKLPWFMPSAANRLEAGADTSGTVTSTVPNMRLIVVGLVTILAPILVIAGCTDDPTLAGPANAGPAVTAENLREAENDGLFPTVVDVTATTSDGASWRVNVTLLSEYDSPARYADSWRVLDADDNELGIRVLAHDHAGEQPFTRSHTVDIPSDVTTMFVEGRDQINGWSGERFELTLDR